MKQILHCFPVYGIPFAVCFLAESKMVVSLCFTLSFCKEKVMVMIVKDDGHDSENEEAVIL